MAASCPPTSRPEFWFFENKSPLWITSGGQACAGSRFKVLLRSLPAFEIIVLQFGWLDDVACQPHGEAAFEHERHRQKLLPAVTTIAFHRNDARPSVPSSEPGGHAVI